MLLASRGNAPAAVVAATMAADEAAEPQLSFSATRWPKPSKTTSAGSVIKPEMPKEASLGPTARINTVLDALPSMVKLVDRAPAPEAPAGARTERLTRARWGAADSNAGRQPQNRARRRRRMVMVGAEWTYRNGQLGPET